MLLEAATSSLCLFFQHLGLEFAGRAYVLDLGHLALLHYGSVLCSWRLLCSSFLVMTCFLIRDQNVLPKKKLHRNLQANSRRGSLSLGCSAPEPFS